jgi:copper chaperone NosL
MIRSILFGTLIFVAAGAWAQAVPGPATTDFRSDVCAECNMAVTSKSYAAQIVGPAKPVFFDDIGCLVQYERQGKIDPKAVAARYVRTVAGDAWVAVDKAVWVLTKDVRTPMGYGLHAFADQKSADAFAVSKKGKVVSWADAQAAVPAAMGAMGKM